MQDMIAQAQEFEEFVNRFCAWCISVVALSFEETHGTNMTASQMDSILRGEVPPELAEDLARVANDSAAVRQQMLLQHQHQAQELTEGQQQQGPDQQGGLTGKPGPAPQLKSPAKKKKTSTNSNKRPVKTPPPPSTHSTMIKDRLPRVSATDPDSVSKPPQQTSGIDYSKWDHLESDDGDEEDEDEHVLHYASRGQTGLDGEYYDGHSDAEEDDEHFYDDEEDDEEEDDDYEEIPSASAADKNTNTSGATPADATEAIKAALQGTHSSILQIRESSVKASADSLKTQGNAAFKAGEYERAIKLYDSALNVYAAANSEEAQDMAAKSSNLFSILPKPTVLPIPVDTALYTNRALAHLKLCDFDKAKEDCDSALALDPKNIKAIWRKVEALRGMRLFSQALSALRDLESKMCTADLTGISADDVQKMIKVVEQETLQHAHEQDLLVFMDNDGSKAFMEQILASLEEGLDEQKGSQISQNLNMTCSVLMKLLDSQDSASDAFRILKGFERLAKRISMDTVSTIMPIFMCLLHNNPVNRKRLSKQLPNILNRIFTVKPDGNRITTTAMVVDLAGNCSRDTDCLQTLIQQASQKWTDNLGITTMTVLAMKRNSVRGSVHIYYALAFANSLLASPKGIDAFFRVYKFNLSHFLTSLGQHFVYESIEGESKSFLDLCMESLFNVLKGEIPVKLLAVNHAMHPLAGAICAAMQHPEAPLTSLISLFHNLCIYLDHPITDILTQYDLPAVLLDHYQCHRSETGISLRVVAKLAKYHGRLVGQTLEDIWQEEDFKAAMFHSRQDPALTKAAVQLLSCWLQTSECNVGHWMRVGGFEHLIIMLRDEGDKAEMDGYVTGNVALCLGECARKAEHTRALVKMGAIDPLVHVLRKTTEPGVQRNLAIVCARLCQAVEGLERVRALKGIELMYGLGNKIVGSVPSAPRRFTF